MINYVKNNKSRKLQFGDAFSIDAGNTVSIDSIKKEGINKQLKNIEVSYNTKEIIFVKDANTNGTFEEFKTTLEDKKILVYADEPVMDFEGKDNDDQSEKLKQFSEKNELLISYVKHTLGNPEQSLEGVDLIGTYDIYLNNKEKGLNDKIEEDKKTIGTLTNRNKELEILSKFLLVALEDDSITADDLKVYAKFNNIDIGQKTAKGSILETINAHFTNSN